MLEKKIFIDFDGVIVDSEDRVIKRREKDNDISWDEFSEKIDWFQLLDESLIINDAINCILEGQEKGKDIFKSRAYSYARLLITYNNTPDGYYASDVFKISKLIVGFVILPTKMNTA